MVMTMDKGKNKSEGYIQDITKKLNDLQEKFRLTCIVSDEHTMFLIMLTTWEDLDYPEDLEEGS